jgi:hypothetical protein
MAGRAKVHGGPELTPRALRRWTACAALALASAGWGSLARGAETEAVTPAPAQGSRVAITGTSEFFRPYGAIEFGLGVLALPDAQVCAGDVGCDRGDVSLEVDAWPLFRASRRFAVGAGITLALTPTQDAPQRDMTFPREHTRRYFLVEGIGRYYFVYGRALEIWSGLSTGLVVVSDNFRSAGAPQNVSIIGSDSANIATEGLTLGLGAGATLGVNESLQVGATLRVANWFLPQTRERIAFGEEASLSDRVTMIHFALTVAYHGH